MPPNNQDSGDRIDWQRLLSWTLPGLGAVIVEWLLGWQTLIYKLLGITVPYAIIFEFFLFLYLAVVLAAKLARRMDSPITGTKILEYPRNSRPRKFLIMGFVATIVTGGLLIVITWVSSTRFPGASGKIYLDRLDAVGWEGINLDEQIRTALNYELKEIMPGMTVELMPPAPPEQSAEERFSWACEGGAILVIHGRADRHSIWPEVKICSRAVPLISFDPYESMISATSVPASLTSALSVNAMPREESIQLCMIDSLVPGRLRYLTLLSLGLVLLYDESIQLPPEERLRKADLCFANALSTEKARSDCQLNYCEALYYKGLSSYGLCMTANDNAERVSYLRGADSCFRTATQLRPDMAPAWAHWANVSTMDAILSGDTNRIRDFEGAEAKVKKAIQIDSTQSDFYSLWGQILYVRGLLEDDDSLHLLAASKFAHSVSLDSTNWPSHLGWAQALASAAENTRELDWELIEVALEKFQTPLRMSGGDCNVLTSWWAALIPVIAATRNPDVNPRAYNHISRFFEATDDADADTCVVPLLDTMLLRLVPLLDTLSRQHGFVARSK